MTTIKQIKYVTQSNNTHHGITRIGGEGWERTTAVAILLMKAQQESYFVKNEGEGVSEVELVEGEYLRAHANGTPNDNLLHLPDFPQR